MSAIRIGNDQPHFTTIITLADGELPHDCSPSFEEGFEFFFNYYFIGCTEQELQNWQEDATFIDFDYVYNYIHDQTKDGPSRKALRGSIKEYWRGYFFAQVTAQKLCQLLYTPAPMAA